MPLNILLIDNYDSYTYNLYHLIAQVNSGNPPRVILNDAYNGDYLQFQQSNPSYIIHCIVISPGPGSPYNSSDVGLSRSCIINAKVPIFGVCLGMQTIAVEFNHLVTKAPKPMHGRLSLISCTNNQSRLLGKNLDFPFNVVRYHSLRVQLQPSLANLVCTAKSVDDDCVMALEHSSLPIFGVQFHPESIGAGKYGYIIMENFLRLVNENLPSPSTSLPLLLLNRDSSRINTALNSPNVYYHLSTKIIHNPSLSPLDAYEELFLNKKNFHSIFLDSSSQLKNANLSILGQSTERIECFVNKNQICTLRVITDESDLMCRDLDIFSYLSQRLGNIQLTTSEALPFDFACGFVGILGYGLRSICGVSSPSSINMSDQIWESTKDVEHLEPDASFIFCTRGIVFDHSSSDCYLLSLHENDNEWMEQMIACLCTEPTTKQSKNQNEEQLLPPVTPLQSETEYIKCVQSCIDYLEQGESYEICFTTRVVATTTRATDPFPIYQQIRTKNPAPFSAFYELSSNLALACSSPERFLSVHNNVVESRPIKGTIARNLRDKQQDDKLAEELENSIKDRAENMMIVDLTRNDLSRVCQLGSVVVPQMMKIESFAFVHQLVSVVQGTLKPNHTAVDALRAAFPPPSMTGAPKLRTMQIIDRLELCERGLYSGALGYLSLNGNADFNVIIRTAIITPNQISIGAGGAITVLSDPKAEYQEMLLKAKTLGLPLTEKS